jgi:hypothetical protein
MGVDVTAPDGRSWHVSRAIRWPRFRRMDGLGDGLNLADGFMWLDGDSIIGGILLAVAVAVLVAILIVVLLPVLLLIVEVVFVLVATFMFRRTWIVTARTLGPPPEVRTWHVRGPIRSRQAVREVGDELSRGVPAAPADWEPA